MTYTNSFHHGTEYVPGHNRRTLKNEAHINPEGKFEIWHDEDITQAYDRIFGEALQEYNAKQKRADRKIKSYLQNVRQNSKLNECYEFIAQVGNEKSHPDEQTCHDILKAYFDGFSARNPGLEVIGGYYHADEVGGCPHIHVDYIPTAPNKKTGLKLKNNLTEALKKLGYETEYVEDTDRGINKKTGKPYTKMVSAEMKFQEAEREALTEICRSYGVEIENPKRKKEEYCTSKQLRQARDIRLQNETKSVELDEKEKKVEVQLAAVTEAKKEIKELKTATAEAEEFLNSVDKPKNFPTVEKLKNISTPAELEKSYPVIKKGVLVKETHYEYAHKHITYILSWAKKNFYDPLKSSYNKLLAHTKKLVTENSMLKAKINTLEKSNYLLSAEVEKIVEERLKSRTEALLYTNKTQFTTAKGNKCTAQKGLLNYAMKVSDELIELRSMTPKQFSRWYQAQNQGQER